MTRARISCSGSTFPRERLSLSSATQTFARVACVVLTVFWAGSALAPDVLDDDLLYLKGLGISVMEGFESQNLQHRPDLVVVGNVVRSSYPEAQALLASDLVLETWVTQGNCGKEEKAVVAQVEQTTQRPESVESDLVKLVKRSRALAVEPHILEMSCPAYRALLDDKGEVDYTKLLAAIARLLEDKVDAIRKQRGPREARAVLVYGGAVHNDLSPSRVLRAFSYAPSLARKTKNGLVSINLYVPEFIERSDYLKAEPWYLQLASVPPGKTAVITRGPRSFIIVFPRGVPVEDPAATPAAPTPPKS